MSSCAAGDGSVASGASLTGAAGSAGSSSTETGSESGESQSSTSEAETGEPGEPGEDCDEDEDCESLLCVEPSPGSGQGICAELCDPDCPEGFACVTLATSMGDAEVCIPAGEEFCEPCENNADCGDTQDFCISFGAGDFCSQDCSDDPELCPPGFTCGIIAGSDAVSGMQCIPDNGICCIDADGDIHGEGAGCLGPDCDDARPEIYYGADELCDGLDNDCDLSVDEDPIDCAAPVCEVGVLGYYEQPGEVCEDGGVCVETQAEVCGLYTCDEGGVEGDQCAQSCDLEDDLKCIPDAHCDASVCEDDYINGSVCDEDSDCQTNHCGNGFCCASGDCCQQAMNCPGFGMGAAMCDNPAACQGSEPQVICTAGFACANNNAADDSGCDAMTLAKGCGLYLDVYCSGASDQTVPGCLNTCSSHADCDAIAYCNPDTDQCEFKRADGEVCGGDDDSWCESDYCENGFCCAGGDCCSVAGDCPGSYTGTPVCVTPTTCSGTLDTAECVSSVCSTQMAAQNDSGCDGATEANECGNYLSVYCDGSLSQTPPSCATSCNADIDCDPAANCNLSSMCVPD